MVKFEKHEREKLRRLESFEHALYSELRHEESHEKSILKKIRYGASKKLVIGLMSAMMFFSNYNKAYADTDRVKIEIGKFNNWLSEHHKQIQEGTISFEDALAEFEKPFEHLEKEVRHDLDEGKYEKALYNLKFFYNLAEHMNSDGMKKRIFLLIREVESEIASIQGHEGVYNVHDKIFVIGTIRATNYNLAKRLVEMEARRKILEFVLHLQGTQGHVVVGNVKGTYIVKLQFIEGEQKYEYVVEIEEVNDHQTTNFLLSHLPKANF